MISLLIKLDQVFPLKLLHEKGILDWVLVRDRDVYLEFDALIKTGKTKMAAYDIIAKIFGLSKWHIMRIVKRLKDEGCSNLH